jgi:hypothetical protein
MPSWAHPLFEIIFPVAVLAWALRFFHRSVLRPYLFDRGSGRALFAVVALLLFTLACWQLLVWAYFLVYPGIAETYGNPVLGAAWDVGLTITLSITLVCWIALTLIYSVMAYRQGRKRAASS